MRPSATCAEVHMNSLVIMYSMLWLVTHSVTPTRSDWTRRPMRVGHAACWKSSTAGRAPATLAIAATAPGSPGSVGELEVRFSGSTWTVLTVVSGKMAHAALAARTATAATTVDARAPRPAATDASRSAALSPITKTTSTGADQ